MSKLQVLSFMFTSNFRRCPFCQNLASCVLYLSKSCMFCLLDQTWLEILVKKGHFPRTFQNLEGTIVIFLSPLSISPFII
ncbi:hypothetical protein Hanom_Chr03g00195181 [Helianthus anomalus]